ncbi:MAG: hypothetical protein JNM68_08360, partial [Dinghuibacter sp.]|nr:hypothetical protein [Dinghuibacter sp.]
MKKSILFAAFLACWVNHTPAQVKTDTVWLKGNRLVKKDDADRYQLPVTQRNGQYVFAGAYINGNTFISGYATNKKNDGRYTNGEIKRFFEDGRLERTTTMGEDSTVVRDAAGTLLYMFNGETDTEYYPNGKPARRTADTLLPLLSKRLNFIAMADSGFFRSTKIPELELFYENGQRAAVVHTRKKLFASFYENGQKAMQLLPREKGYLLESFFRSGKIRSRYVLNAKFKRNGSYTLYYENGNLREQGTALYNDEYSDTCFNYRYYPNGRLFAKTRCVVINDNVEQVFIDVQTPASDNAPQPVPEKKPEPRKKGPPVAFCYDVQGKEIAQYERGNFSEYEMDKLLNRQMMQQMREGLTPAEQKYTVLSRDSVDYDGYRENRDLQAYLHKRTKEQLNGGYIILHDGRMKICTFNQGIPAKEKVFVGFEPEYGVYRLAQNYAGLDIKKRYAVKTAIYDRDSYNTIDMQSGTWSEAGFYSHRYGKTVFDVSQPTISFDIVPHIGLLVNDPRQYLWSNPFPSKTV